MSVVRSPVPYAITSGYYNFPEATVETFRNLWFHTGDLAYRDDDGYYFFVDRKKDSIRRRGENVSAYEVERALNAHEAVLESAAIAVPAELGDDEIKACVVPRPGARVSPEELLTFCDERLPRFMVPRYVEFLEELPKTATEKIEKYRLRAEGDRGITPGTWDRQQAGFQFSRTSTESGT
jgi:crotonobetaine/carnitine-CoA ligase